MLKESVVNAQRASGTTLEMMLYVLRESVGRAEYQFDSNGQWTGFPDAQCIQDVFTFNNA